VSGGFFSVPTVGDLSSSGRGDQLVGGIEGYFLHYRCLRVSPLQFARSVRLRRGDEEIRRFGKLDPAGGVADERTALRPHCLSSRVSPPFLAVPLPSLTADLYLLCCLQGTGGATRKARLTALWAGEQQ
jgi:hypothetical protein